MVSKSVGNYPTITVVPDTVLVSYYLLEYSHLKLRVAEYFAHSSVLILVLLKH